MKNIMIPLGVIVLTLASWGCASAPHEQHSSAGRPDQERPSLADIFKQHDAKGTMIVVDQRGDAPTTQVHNPRRAAQRYAPASTFKIPHALFALESGVVRDEFQVFRWDGTERSYKPWNRDQDLRSSMRHSTVWVYQWIAGQIGEEQERAYLEKIHYGNADASGGIDGFWVDGGLRITAHEQVAFLQRLYRNELPFKVEHQRLVKDIMIVEAGRKWILRAKTGWEGRYGWWVGWVEHPKGPVFFALNIDTPNRWDDLYKREAIARDVLQTIGALPEPKH